MNTHVRTWGSEPLLYPFYRWGTQSLESLSNFPMVTHPSWQSWTLNLRRLMPELLGRATPPPTLPWMIRQDRLLGVTRKIKEQPHTPPNHWLEKEDCLADTLVFRDKPLLGDWEEVIFRTFDLRKPFRAGAQQCPLSCCAMVISQHSFKLSCHLNSKQKRWTAEHWGVARRDHHYQEEELQEALWGQFSIAKAHPLLRGPLPYWFVWCVMLYWTLQPSIHLAEGPANAEPLRLEAAWCVWGAERRPLWWNAVSEGGEAQTGDWGRSTAQIMPRLEGMLKCWISLHVWRESIYVLIWSLWLLTVNK